MFVAGFIGETNFLPVAVSRDDKEAKVTSPLIGDDAAAIAWEQVSPFLGSNQTALLVRPETIRFVTGAAEPGEWVLNGTVEEYFIKGASTQYRVRVPGLDKAVVMDLAGSLELPAKVSDSVRIGFHPTRCFLLSE
ncbi:TOBE domain-containing protein [Mesorhizobium sp. PAMC28654]|nr:TOBE domain-containing protein [Mesorhizobium sp. PAMC28654]